MHYIVYGSNYIEKNIFKKISSDFNDTNTLYVMNDAQVEEIRSSVRYAPFFSPKWLVVVSLNKLSKENVMKMIALVKNPLVQLYCHIPNSKKFNKPNKDLFDSLKKSKVIGKLENLQILNALYPNNDYIKKLIFSKLKGTYLSDNALAYFVENIRFDLDNLENILTELKDTGKTHIDIKDMREILPRTQTRSLKHYVYSVLLCNRGDLKEFWNDPSKRVLSQNGGTKEKPYNILDEVSLTPDSTLNIIISILSDMVKLKAVYQKGYYTINSIFDQKEKLDNQFSIIKKLSIPTITDYTKVFSEVSRADLLYVLTTFVKLKSEVEISEDSLYLTTKLMMDRFKEENK